ncbi:MAG: hypothetical protein JWP25_3600 [Bradyrhizobium sp.]|nr:hypothetical protein [Bradyrhizobium sp.]
MKNDDICTEGQDKLVRFFWCALVISAAIFFIWWGLSPASAQVSSRCLRDEGCCRHIGGLYVQFRDDLMPHCSSTSGPACVPKGAAFIRAEKKCKAQARRR